jgi:hypothetical protein
MTDLILPYLFGLITTAVVLFLSSFNYFRGTKERVHYERERALLPDAVRLEKLVEMRRSAQDEYDLLAEKVSDARAVVSERDDAHAWLEANREKLLQLKAERETQEAVRTELDSLRAEIDKKFKEKQELDESIATLKGEHLFHQSLRDQSLEEIQRLEDSKRAIADEIIRLESALEPMRIRIAGIESQIEVAREREQAVLEGLKAQNQQLLRQIEQSNDRINAQRLELEATSREFNLLREQIGESQIAKQKVIAAIDSLEAELQFQGQLRDKATEELKALEASKQDLVAERVRLESSLEPLRVQLAGIEGQIDAAKERERAVLEGLKAQNQQLVSQLDQTRDLLKTARNDFDELTNKTQVLNEQRSRISAEVQGLEREKVALEDLIKNLRQDWNTVLRLTGQDEGADARRTQELWQPYIRQKASDFPQKSARSEAECLQGAEQYLTKRNLYFPKRVLRAFHTSLKVTDISPLVVLAGISGTGKSELPRRYAESMGMHFLNVAVQPRWDSPQDMFGFFNYLENRYRATELGRALVQMDPFYKEENRGWSIPEGWDHSLSSQMLLILLDEMNLARVEYYFSEFLSRLETRRGIDRNDPESRRKAEIGLEVGSGKSKTPIMQLFVDRNVLFVGTMNEDETTQALSDKVIDRANVLRFGRPGRVEKSPEKGNKESTDSRIPYAVWNSWCRTPESLPDDLSVRVGEYIDTLDEAMMEIKRPFGFRTRNSILSYVANYPNVNDDSAEDAVADQIEQKILPKFRGLDPRDNATKSALSKIKNLLSRLKDDLLIQAIDQSSRDGQFVWMGVNRFAEQLDETI